MNETVWIETQSGDLINLSKIAFIKPYSFQASVELRAYFTEDVPPLLIAEVNTLKEAQRFLQKVAELIKTNVKCIDANMLVNQVQQ